MTVHMQHYVGELKRIRDKLVRVERAHASASLRCAVTFVESAIEDLQKSDPKR